MIIAEIGQAHDGSLGILHSYIDSLAGKGVDAVKFQTHIASAESSIEEPFRVKFSYEDKTRFDYWKRMEFSSEQWAGIKQHCEMKGMEFISSPFSIAAVDLLERLNTKRYKIGSGEVNNGLLLNRISDTGKPVIISSGLSSLSELDKSVELLKSKKADISVLQCISAYPSTPEQWGLNMIKIMKERYGLKTGFSDHSGNIYACLAAAALGAEIFEFHVVFHKQMFGPDTPASIEIDEVQKLTEGIRQIKLALNSPTQKILTNEVKAMKNIFEKSLAVNKFLVSGTRIELHHLEAKKPKGKGIDASEYQNIIGKILARDKLQWDFLNYDDFV